MRTKFITSMLITAMAVGMILSQSFQGTLRGVVEDPQGTRVPGAEVTLVNDATGETRTQITSDIGNFSFPGLLVSKYSLTVQVPGFKRYSRTEIEVKANQVAEVKVALELGGLDEEVLVTAGAELVQTTDTQLTGATFDDRSITELPVAGVGSDLTGNPINLAIFAPGTSTQSGGVVGQGGSIGGNRPRQNNFVVDGVDNNDPSVTGSLAPVIQEAVEEFTLLTNQFSAEYGHSTAGQFITTTKSGGNEIHGRAWWFSQNRHTNALDNLTRATTAPGDDKPRYDWNRFGGQAGGPIIRDKFFIFGSYEYQNLSLAGTPSGQILVPTSAGMSALQNLAADPNSGVSPIAVGILQGHVPTAPTATESTTVLNEGTGALVPIELGVFSATTPQFDRTHLMLLSGDYQTQNHRFSGRYHYSRQRNIQAGELPTDEFSSNQFQNTHRVTFSDVWSIKPTVVNEFRAGYNRNANGAPVDLPPGPGNTDVFSNYSIADISLPIGPQSNYPQSGADNVYQLSQNTSFLVGSHTFKMGIDFRDVISASDFLPRARGDYVWPNLDVFARDFFPSSVSIRGVGLSRFAQNRSALYAFVHDKWNIHPRVTLDLGLRYEYTQVARDSNLQTLNGLANVGSVRDEVFTADHPNVSGPDDPLVGTKIFDSLSPVHQQALLAHVGESLIFKNPAADRNNFAPRIGLAWDVFGDGKTSVRAGFAVAHDVLFGNLALLQLPPQAQAENRETNACALLPAPAWCAQVAPGGDPLSSDIRHSTIGFLAGGGLLPTLPTEALTDKFVARAATGAFVLDDIVPESYTWSLSVQRQLRADYLVEARYVGNHAIHLPIQNWKSAGVPNPFRLPTFLTESDALAQDFTGAPTLADFTGARDLLLAPYGFGGVLTQFTPNGQSWYHGASAAVQKRMTKGLTFSANYTWSKTIDLIENDLFTSYMNPRRPFNHLDINANKGLSGLNHDHKFAITWLYEVPRFDTETSFLNQVVNGWQINGSFVAETGQPLTIISRNDLNGDFDTAGDTAIENPAGIANTGTGVNFVCWSGGATSIDRTGDCGGSSNVVGYVAQDASAQFIRGGVGSQSNVGRNTFKAAGINTWNLSLFKNFELPREEMKLQFRIEFWNAFNHPNFVIGNGSVFNTTANSTGVPGYVTPGTSQFLQENVFSGGLGNAPYQRIIQWGLRLLF